METGLAVELNNHLMAMPLSHAVWATTPLGIFIFSRIVGS